MKRAKVPLLTDEERARLPSLAIKNCVARAGYSLVWTATCNAADIAEQKGEDEEGTKLLCILKESRKRKQHESEEKSLRYDRAVAREIAAYKLLQQNENQQPYFVNLYTTVALQHARAPALLLECFTSSTQLTKVIARQSYRPHLKALFTTIVKAVDAAHACGVAHHDLKPDNILLRHNDSASIVFRDEQTQEEEKEVDLKLIDFGMSHPMSEEMCCGPCGGTPAYAAPEVLWAQQHCSAHVDSWSLGTILYELVIGKPLLHGNALNDFRYLAMHIDARQECATLGITDVDNGVMTLICMLTLQTPRERPTPKQILRILASLTL